MTYHMLVIWWNVIFRFYPVFTGFCRIFRCKIWENFFVCPHSNKKNLSWKFQHNLTTNTMKIAIIRVFPDFSEKPDKGSGFFWTKNHPMPKTKPTKKSLAKSVQAFLNESTNHFMAYYDHYQGLLNYYTIWIPLVWGLVDELRNSKIFAMEAVEDRIKSVWQKSCVLALCITCNWEKNFI